MTKRLIGLFMGAGLCLLTIACGPDRVQYTIELSEFAFTPDIIELKMGQEVTLKIVNSGAMTHELMIGRQVASSETGMPNGYMEDLFSLVEISHTGQDYEVMGLTEDGDHDHTDPEDHSDHDHSHPETSQPESDMAHMHVGGMFVLPPKEEAYATVTFVVTAEMVGEWEMGCFTDGGVHYNEGMIGKLIVSP